MSITLKELILAVKDNKLTKTQLEEYRDAMSDLFANMQIEMAELEKTEALFMHDKGDEKSGIKSRIYSK